jgi:hypothetical protein
MDKSLKNKAIDIKGKQYVLVSDRILYFNENYVDGSITTELVSQPSDELVVIKATVRPNTSDRAFTGYSQAKWGDGYINKTSALENCETSAVGRALAMMGIGVIDSVASVDEINKAQTQPEYVPHTPNKTGDKNLNVATQAQRKRIMELCHELDIPLSADDKVEFTKLCMETIGKPNPTTVGETEIVITVLETMLQDKEAGL